MDITGFASYILSGFTLFAGIVIFFGENEYIVPASGRLLGYPALFSFGS